MAVSAFTVANIKPSLNIDSSQRFIFGSAEAPEPLGSFKLDNIFVPTISISSQTNFETRNNTLSGFRWMHTTNNTDTFGRLKLQSFVNAQTTGTDILSFNSDGTVIINNLNVTSPFRIQYNSPFSALYLVGPITTQAGFVYNNTSTETLLFSATDLRISSTSGQIHFSLDSSTNDFITFNNQGFKSIVNFIANNPDTTGFIPEKGLIFQTLGTNRGALTFDRVVNQMKLYTSTNDPIVFATNNVNSMQILTNANIDLLNHRITNAANPVNAQDYATKNYVDNIVITPTITITGAVSGSGTGTVNTILNPSQSIIGDTQLFNYNANPIARFGIINLRVPAVGVPCFTTFDLSSSSGSGYKFLTTFSTTDTNGLGQFKLQAISSTFGVFDVFTSSVITGVTNTTFNGTINVSTPTISTQAANKQYVDDNIANLISSNPITLTGAVIGINSINNPIFTSFSSTIPLSGANQTFNFSLNSNVVYRLNNTLAATTGTPSTIALSLNNATNGGYRFLHTSTSTDTAGLGTLKFQVINSSSVIADLFTASVNTGSGIPDTFFNGTATFNNAVTVQNNQSIIVTGNSAVADYLVMNNTNLSSKTQLRINVTGLPVATFGYDAAVSQVYIDSPFGAGSPFVIKFGGTTRFSIDSATGNINLFNSRITNAANPVNAQDYATKNYVDATAGSPFITLTGAITGSGAGTIATTLTPTVNINSASYAFNLNNANGSGITEFQISYGIPYLKFGVNSAGAGNYIDSIFDNFIIKMAGVDRFIFSTAGNLGIGGLGPTQAKLVINGGVQNIVGEDSALRVISALNNVKIELQNTAASGKIYEIRSTSIGSLDIFDRTGSAARFTLTSAGNIGIGGSTIPNAPLQFGNVLVNRKIVLYEGTNNDHQYYGWGINGGILRYQVDQLTSDHVFYAASSSTTSNELFRAKGNGDTITAGTIYGRRISGLVTMQGNVVGTTVTTGGTFYKVAGVTSATFLNGLTSSISNRLTNTSSYSIVVAIDVAITASHNGAGGDEIQFAIYKNGLQVSNSIISGEDGANRYITYDLTTITTMAINDYIELWCSHPANGKIITVKNLQIKLSTT